MELRTTASSFNSPSTMAKISLSGEPTATTSSVTMKAPEALKSNTREVCLRLSNFQDTHIPDGVATRRFFLLSGSDSGLGLGLLLSALNFNNVSLILQMTIDLTRINTVSSCHESRCSQLCTTGESMAILIDATGTLIPESFRIIHQSHFRILENNALPIQISEA